MFSRCNEKPPILLVLRQPEGNLGFVNLDQASARTAVLGEAQNDYRIELRAGVSFLSSHQPNMG